MGTHKVHVAHGLRCVTSDELLDHLNGPYQECMVRQLRTTS